MELIFFIIQVTIGIILTLFLTGINSISIKESDDLIVQLTKPAGRIRGHILQSQNGKEFYAFQDVPYAQSTTGKNRFQPPKPLDDWDDVLDTTKNQKICPQIIKPPEYLTMTEDCLVLNVFSPVKPGSNTSLPVYLWIHGGAFISGCGSFYGPHYFIDYDIIIVTINYRLGVLGFLTTNDESIPGNIGLKDQHFAIKWVFDNIYLFGGDPKQITVGGESAGGISVGYHLLSKKSEGLIKAVIQQSGSSLNTFGTQVDYEKHAFEFGRLIDPSFISNNTHDLLDILQTALLSNIIDTQLKLLSNESIGFLKGSYWKPIIEDKNNPNAFITGPIGQDFLEGHFNLIPALIGFNSEESLLFYSQSPQDIYNKSAKMLDDDPTLMISNKLNINEAYKESAVKSLKQLYSNEPFFANKSGFVRYCSDAGYIHPLSRQADLTSAYIPVYLYKFSYGDALVDVPGADKVAHSDEVKYFWKHTAVSTKPINKTIQTAMLKFWVNFIKEQNPTPVEDADLQNIIWPTTQPGTLQYLNINETFVIETNPRLYQETFKILDKLIVEPYTIY